MKLLIVLINDMSFCSFRNYWKHRTDTTSSLKLVSQEGLECQQTAGEAMNDYFEKGWCWLKKPDKTEISAGTVFSGDSPDCRNRLLSTILVMQFSFWRTNWLSGMLWMNLQKSTLEEKFRWLVSSWCQVQCIITRFSSAGISGRGNVYLEISPQQSEKSSLGSEGETVFLAQDRPCLRADKACTAEAHRACTCFQTCPDAPLLQTPLCSPPPSVRRPLTLHSWGT